MGRELKQPELDALEALVDSTSMPDVLRALAWIADQKADHIATNWQDEALADRWEKICIACVNAADRAERLTGTMPVASKRTTEGK